jgi:hypothetical protein
VGEVERSSAGGAWVSPRRGSRCAHGRLLPRHVARAACSHAEHFGLREAGFGKDTKGGAGREVGRGG